MTGGMSPMFWFLSGVVPTFCRVCARARIYMLTHLRLLMMSSMGRHWSFMERITLLTYLLGCRLILMTQLRLSLLQRSSGLRIQHLNFILALLLTKERFCQLKSMSSRSIWWTTEYQMLTWCMSGSLLTKRPTFKRAKTMLSSLPISL
jgi:hypothetical protein